MTAESFRHYPPRPADEAEWEDLLLRLELGPRALRLALEDREDPPAALLEPLDRLVRAELWMQQALRAMRTGEAIPEQAALSHADPADPPAAARKRLQEYTALRMDSFGALQRRGIEVWEWSAALPGGERVTAPQLVRHALQADGEALAAVRAAGRAAEREGGR